MSECEAGNQGGIHAPSCAARPGSTAPINWRPLRVTGRAFGLEALDCGDLNSPSLPSSPSGGSAAFYIFDAGSWTGPGKPDQPRAE